MTRTLDLIYPTPIASIDTGRDVICHYYSKLISASMTANDRAKLELEGFYTTDDDLHTRDEYKELFDLIESENKNFFKDILNINPDHLKMQNMWSNTYSNKTRHHVHQHPNAYFSGVFYLDLPSGPDTDPGKLFFHDPRPAASMQVADYTKETHLNYRSWWYTPKVGLMVLFPSWMPHGTDAPILKDGQKRMSLSWNYVLTTASIHTMKLNYQQGS